MPLLKLFKNLCGGSLKRKNAGKPRTEPPSVATALPTATETNIPASASHINAAAQGISGNADTAAGGSHDTSKAFTVRQIPEAPLAPEDPHGLVASPGAKDSEHATDSMAQSGQELSQRLWDEAYESLEVEKGELIDSYLKTLVGVLVDENFKGLKAKERKEAVERILDNYQDGLGAEDASEGSAATDSSAVAELNSPGAEISARIKDRANRLKYIQELVTKGQVKVAVPWHVAERIGDVANVFNVIKPVVDTVLQIPHAAPAALPWAGVCAGLKILSNPGTVAGSNLKGIAHVVSRMDWYCVLVDHLLQGDPSLSDVRQKLERQVVKLYAAILLYQMKSVCCYYKNQFGVFLKSLVILDEWTTLLASVELAETTLLSEWKTYSELEAVKFGEKLGKINDQLGDIHQTLWSFTAQQKDWRTEDLGRQTGALENKCLRNLRVVNPQDDMESIEREKGRSLPEQYEWILEDENYAAFTNWDELNSKPCRVLWVKGHASKDTSKLIINVVRELSSQPATFARTLSYFFCQTPHGEPRDATIALRSLIWMLLLQEKTLFSHLLPEFDSSGQALFTDKNAPIAMRRVFKAMLADLKSPAYFVVDGLDDYGRGEEDLNDLLTLISDSLALSHNARWLVSSRQETRVLASFNQDTLATVLELDMKSHHDHIEEQKIQDYRNQWEHTMTRIQNEKTGFREHCWDILTVVSLVRGPLSFEELSVLADLPAEVRPYPSICEPFLTVKEERVSLVHKSANGYLQENRPRLLGTAVQGHRDIVKLSINAMSVLKRDLYGIGQPGVQFTDITTPQSDPLAPIRYSCLLWLVHLRSAIIDEPVKAKELCNIAFEFLKEHFLHWLESACILHIVSPVIRSIRELRKAVQLSEAYPEFLGFLEDAERFAATNRSIIEQTPLQIYGAALAFCPTQSEVKKLFWKQRWPFVEKTAGVRENWDLYQHMLTDHGGPVEFITFSPDGKMLASATRCEVRLWSFDAASETWDCKQTRNLPWILSIAFSPDSRTLVLALKENILFWVVGAANASSTTSQLNHITQETAIAVAFSPDGKMLAAASRHHISFWAIGTATTTATSTNPKHSVDCYRFGVEAIAFSPDGKTLVSASQHGMDLWAVNTETTTVAETGRKCSTYHKEQVHALAFSPNGETLALASIDGMWLLPMDTAATTSFQEPREFLTTDVRDRPVRAIAFSPDGETLVSASGTGLRLWPAILASGTETREPIQMLDHSVAAIAWSPDGKTLASTENRAVRLQSMDISIEPRESGPATECHRYPLEAVAFSPDHQILVSASRDGARIWVLDAAAENWECKQTLGLPNNSINAVAFSPDGRKLAFVLGCSAVQLWSIDRADMTAVQEPKGILRARGITPMSITFSPNSNELVYASSNAAYSWATDAATLKSKPVQGFYCQGLVAALAFSPDGKTLASASRVSEVKLWGQNRATAAWECKQSLKGHERSVTAVAFSPDGKRFASADEEVLLLWSITASGVALEKPSRRLPVGVQLTNLSFSEDSQHLAADQGMLYVSDSGTLVRHNSVSTTLVKDDWIIRNGRKLLWLPPDYRATCSAVCDGLFVLGHVSGRITFLYLAAS